MNDKASDLTVYKDNYLVEASYKLSLMEQRIMLFAISKLDPRSPQREHSFLVSELLKFYPDIEPSSAYRALREAVYKLSERWVRTEDPEKIREFRWISSRTYFKDEGRIDINFTPEIMPYLSQLEGQFTKYRLENIASFRGTYSIRIYELLTQYKMRGNREISIDNLRTWLQAESKYDTFKALNQWAIKPAIEEINQKSDLQVSVEPIKRGRKITALKFVIGSKRITEEKAPTPKSTGTRLIHGVFEETTRPQVVKGSQAEYDWAYNNLVRVRQEMREKGIYKGFDLDNDLDSIPTEWLKVISKFATIADKYLSRAVSDELFKRKA